MAYNGHYDPSAVPLPTSRAPPVRQPTRSGNGGLGRSKTLTRPERGVAQAPLITAPQTILPPSGAVPISQVVSVGDAYIWDPWTMFSYAVTFWAPAFILSTVGGIKDQRTRQAWREKVALCFIAIILGGAVGFATMGLDRVLCPTTSTENTNRFSRIGSVGGTVSINGIEYNTTQALIQNVNWHELAFKSPGQDVTNFFTRTAASFPACNGLRFAAATDNPCINQNFCKEPAPTNATLTNLKLFPTGKLSGFDWEHVANETTYLVIDGVVVNMTPYILAHPNPIPNDKIDSAIRTVLTGPSTKFGKDATRLFYQREELREAVPCLSQRYLAGNIDKITPGCFASQLFLYISLIVIMSLVLARFAMACIFNWFLSAKLVAPPKNLNRTVISPSVLPEGANVAVDNKNGTAPWAGAVAPKKLHKSRSASPASSKTAVSPNGQTGQQPLITMAQIGAELFCVCLVTCYSEGEESLRTTCDSISTTTYSDARKLLFIVADGMITGEGEKMSTPDICVSLLEQDTRFGDPQPMGYIAVGMGAKRENCAKVYAGHYTVAGRRTPTLVIAKCGTEKEAQTEKKPGNRGKRDSQLILMNFFSRVTYNDRMTPLDFDMFRKMHVLMGVTPDFFEVCLMVDADTKVYPDSLKHLVNCMQHDNLIMGVCGETRIANKRQSWVTAIQVYEYYISHHLAKAFESVFGGVTCLPGCFSMYRLKARKSNDDDWVPLITKPEIVREYSQSDVRTLHQKNLLLLGEDRFLTTVLLRSFPNRKMMFCPQARCRTIAPDTFAVLLSQRRRWINSTIHNLMELVRVRNLCGTFCFSMQFVVFMDLLGTTVLPVALVLTYALAISLALNPPKNFEQAIPLMMLATVLGLPAVLILITTRKVVYVFWMLAYLLGLPVWNLILPLYAFWHFDDFSWGETRRVEGEGATKAHDDDHGAVTTGPGIPLRRWEDWERSRLKKIKRDEKRRRELERNYPGPFLGGNNGYASSHSSFALHPPASDDGAYESDSVSVVSSNDEDQWGAQIGAYNENSPRYPPPPATLHPASGSGGSPYSKETDSMNSPHIPPLPPALNTNATRYQLSDVPSPFGANNPYAPIARSPTAFVTPGPPRHVTSPTMPDTPPNAISSAVESEWKTHAKRRSGGRPLRSNGQGGPPNEEWGPLGPLGPSRDR